MELTQDVNVKNIQNFLSLHYVVFKIASEVVRMKFCEKWKSIFRSDWTNSEENGRKFIDGVGKSVFHSSKSIQKSLLKSGNVNAWDLPLIIQSIKCLESYANPTASSRKTADVADEYKKLDNLKEIRNQLSHQPTSEVTEENFHKYWEATSRILLSFGVAQQTLDEAKNLKFTETSPICSNNLTSINETKAVALKEQGNKCHAAKNYQEAINVYTEAIQLSGISIELLATLYSNRSLMYLELNDMSNAKDDANGVIHMNPTWWRGYARLGSTYEKLKKFEKAIKNYELALQLNPPDIHIKIVTDSLYYCRRMLGKINRMESMQPHNFIHTMKEAIDDANKRLGLNTIDQVLAYTGINMSDNSNSDPATSCAQGHLFLRGIGCPQDFESAANRFAKAAGKGSADGMYNLGTLLLEGKGIKRNTQYGIDMLEQAAAQPSFILQGKLQLKNEGVSEAKHAIGLAYYEGSGVPKDIQTAFEWWSRATEEDGNGASANNIGIMYEEGEFVSRDIDKAILYWKFAAWDDLNRAMQNLFRVYMNRHNYNEASYWYRLAIENGYVKDAIMEKVVRRLRLGKFDSKLFTEKLKTELKASRFRNIVLQCEQATKNRAQMIKGDRDIERIVHPVRKSDSDFIVEHRKWFKKMNDVLRQTGRNQTATVFHTHPTKLKGTPDVDIIGLKPIYFKDMIADVEKIYEGHAIKVIIIDDATTGQPSVNVIGQDNNGTIQRIFIYNFPQNEETQDKVGYGCTLTIVNPYYKMGADGMPMIRVDDPSTILYHTTVTNKKRCRYCGNPEGTILCRKCERCYYCSTNCLTLDADQYQHKLVCIKKL